jgi:hypothetical protein
MAYWIKAVSLSPVNAHDWNGRLCVWFEAPLQEYVYNISIEK